MTAWNNLKVDIVHVFPSKKRGGVLRPEQNPQLKMSLKMGEAVTFKVEKDEATRPCREFLDDVLEPDWFISCSYMSV